MMSTLLFAAITYQPLTIKNVVREMSPGMNLGNTLEALPTETSWGNPKPTDAYFQSVRKAGFRSIRIPVSYSQYANAKNEIKPEWMKHVVDVVKMARKADLIVMVNIHWDGGWLQPTIALEASVMPKFVFFWRQIATALQDSDDRVLFAGTNEVHVEGNYNPPTEENAEVQNRFNQAFVKTVRATKGKNEKRLIIIQAYNTGIENAVKVNAKLPLDPTKNALLMEVHYYSPYHFALDEKSSIWQWGKNATDPKSTDTWGNEDYVDAQFQMMKSEFVDKGVPVILGEYGVGLKPKYPGMIRYRDDWMEYVTRSAVAHGMAPMVWDTGQMFDRKSGKQKEPVLIQKVVTAAR